MSETTALSTRSPADLRSTSGLSGWKAQLASLRAWAAPGDPVLLLHADGGESVWQGALRLPAATRAGKPKFVAVQLPEDLVLTRSLLLPRMSDAHVADAIALEARSNSPFAPDDLAWGSLVKDVDGGQKRVSLALTSRHHVSAFMQERWPALAAAARQPEVWAVAAPDAPIVIQGYGEIHRLSRGLVERRWTIALAALALALATLVAITPTIQLRLRTVEAVAAFDAVLRRVAPLVRKRDELAALNDKVRSLEAIAAERVDPAGVMDYLTRILPDDTYLYALDMQKTKITASGHTPDASAVLQKLSADPRLKNVRSPTAVTRLPGATKEAFVIEFTMEPRPEAAGLSGAAGAAPVTATPAVVPASSSVPVAVPAASASASPVASTGVPAAPAGPAAATAPVSAAQQKPVSRAPPAGGSSPFVIGGSR